MTFFPDVTFRVFARNPVPSAVGPTRLTTDNEENVRWMAVKSGPIAHPRLSNGSNTNTLDGDMTDSPLGHSAKVWRRDGKSMCLPPEIARQKRLLLAPSFTAQRR